MGHTALVWGAGGIGQAVARALSERGCVVLVVGRRLDALADVTDLRFECEVDQPFSVQSALVAVGQEVEEIDLWVYAIGDAREDTRYDRSASSARTRVRGCNSWAPT